MRSYLFIDGEYLRRNYAECVRRWFGSDGEIDFEQVKAVFGAERAFYYDAIDDREQEGENVQDYDARVARQKLAFNRIQELDGYFVRLGSLGGRDKKQQKQVDILLAVEALDFAVGRIMDRAILLSGDRDFEPLVHSLVRLGVRVEVAGDKKNTSPFLRHAADRYKQLSFDDYHNLTIGSLRGKFPISIRQISMPPHESKVLERATSGTKQFMLKRSDSTTLHYIYGYQYYAEANHLTLEFNDVDRLKLYFELQYGKVTWHQTEGN